MAKMENLGMGFDEVVARFGHAALDESSTSAERSSESHGSFQWAVTLCALFLLLLNRIGQRSSIKTTLLVVCLFTSFPTALFNIIRGQFGYWIAFLAVTANLFWPQIFPASRFLVFVITPDWLADGLRSSIFSGILCLLIGVLLLIIEVRGIGGYGNFRCSFCCFAFFLGIALLCFFTIWYLVFTL